MREVDELVNKIADHVRAILELLGLDLSNPDLAETPHRVARMLLELTAGLREKPPEVKFFRIPLSASKNLVVIRDIEFESLCEHHLLPVVGYVSVAYKPRGELVPGLSKVVRLVQWFARRPILQERFTQELAELLYEKLDAKFVYCRVRAVHMCVFVRGVRSRSTILETEATAGDVDEDLDTLRRIATCRSPVL